MKNFYSEHNEKERDDWEFMGHSQSTFNPEAAEDVEAASDNLFARFEEVADDKDSKWEVMERKLRSFMSLYVSLGKDEQPAAEDRVNMLLSQTRSDYSRNQKIAGGTPSVVVEQHGKRSRTFNTHHSYYK